MNSIGTSKQFAEPWNNGWQEKSGFPKPPMEVHNSFYDNTQVEVRYKNQGLRLSVEGEVCIDPGYKIDPKRIKEMIEMLPALWKWGQDVRRSQDAIFVKICTILPEWEIIFSERERTFFCAGTLREIENLLEKFKQTGEKIPTVQKCKVDEVISRLEKAWEETKTQIEKNEKIRKEENERTEKHLEERKEKNEAKKKEAEKILQKAGLM